MAKHTVDVLIKARDHASKKFALVGTAAAVMGRALKSVSHIAKTALVTAFKVAKKAAIGLAAAFAYATYAAIKQEAAEIELASALKVTGQYTEENFRKLKAYAAELQKQSTYGDEYILTLERMALSLGWTADQAGAAAKAAIALHAGFGGGRGKPEIFLRYYTDAMQGNVAALGSYIVELKSAKTAQEAFEILQRKLVIGWDVAKSKAESTGGALKQMRAVLGDVAETIANPFLPAIKRSAQAVKDWAIQNMDNISLWAQKTYSSVVVVKDIFMEFVNFMKEDWRTGLSFAFDSFLELMKTAFNSAVTLAIAGGRGIAKGIKDGLLGRDTAVDQTKLAGKMYELYVSRALAAKRKGETLGLLKKGTPLYEELEKIAIGQVKTESILGNSLTVVKEAWKKSFEDIINKMPHNFREAVDAAFEKHLQRLQGIAGAPGAGAGADTSGGTGTFGELARSILSNIKQTLSPLEARFLTFAPGTRFGKSTEEKNAGFNEKTSKGTNEMIKLAKQSVNLLRSLPAQIQAQQVMNVLLSNFH